MLQLKEKGDNFHIFYKNREILSHSSKAPAVAVGRGKGRYKFNYGLFKIKDSQLKLYSPKMWSTELSEDRLISIILEDRVRIVFKIVSEGVIPKDHLRIDIESLNASDNRIVLNLSSHQDQAIYGCGEQYTHLNMKGRNVPIWVMEPGLGRGKDLISLMAEVQKGYAGRWYTSYVSQPTYLSTSGRFVHSDSTAYTEFDFRTGNKETLTVWEGKASFHLGEEEDPAALLEGLTSYLGRQPALPDWIYSGMILGIQGGREETSSKLQDARDAGVKVSAIWCQDWEGIRMTSFGKQLFWNWKASEELYGDLKEYIRTLEKEGIHYLGYINPFLALEGDLYQEAREKNYCIKNSQGEDYYVTITTFPAAMVDLSNPEAAVWIKEVIKKYMIGVGLKGWMADFGEYIPADAVIHSGESAETYHNRYTVEWARINREACQEAGTSDMFVFMRSAYSGSAPSAVSLWNGDQLVNWSRHQGFPTIIPGSLSLGYSGYGNVHSDLGGYTTIAYIKRSKELFLRWCEASAFSPVMRTHEGNRPYKGWLFNSDEESLKHLAGFTRLFKSLAPYHKEVCREYGETGLPQMRHGWLVYPDDKIFRTLQYQYFYGNDLLVAPVLKKGQKKQRVYIPDASWINVWTGVSVQAGWHTAEAPIGRPPVYYRSGSDFEDLLRSIPAAVEGDVSDE